MFDKFKAMGAVAGLLKNQDKIKDAMARVQEKMDRTRVEGQAGGGACRAVVSGKMKVLEVSLAPALVSGMAAHDRTRELAGNLISEAVNDALSKAQAKLKEAIDAEARDLGLPDLSAGMGGLLS